MDDDHLTDEFKALIASCEALIQRQVISSDEPVSTTLADLGTTDGSGIAESAWEEALRRVDSRVRVALAKPRDAERGVPEGIAA